MFLSLGNAATDHQLLWRQVSTFSFLTSFQEILLAMFTTAGRTFSNPRSRCINIEKNTAANFPQGLRERTRRHEESEMDKNSQGRRRKSGIRKNFGKGANPQGLQGKTEAILQQRRSVHKGLRRKENHFPSSGKKRKRHRDFQKGQFAIRGVSRPRRREGRKYSHCREKEPGSFRNQGSKLHQEEETTNELNQRPVPNLRGVELRECSHGSPVSLETSLDFQFFNLLSGNLASDVLHHRQDLQPTHGADALTSRRTPPPFSRRTQKMDQTPRGIREGQEPTRTSKEVRNSQEFWERSKSPRSPRENGSHFTTEEISPQGPQKKRKPFSKQWEEKEKAQGLPERTFCNQGSITTKTKGSPKIQPLPGEGSGIFSQSGEHATPRGGNHQRTESTPGAESQGS
ncbi:hypothetical protein TcasGA2_TC031947 [Tribolium castaneum]|uniref:Uncharacterized protein n=1 Tax=Tribolium castaneum TaxID=7070 RepID=A0A139W9T4_TRICA|nr:hypothetical protein TcasGA2_TC031947 [Tribolium castaneum]